MGLGLLASSACVVHAAHHAAHPPPRAPPPSSWCLLTPPSSRLGNIRTPLARGAAAGRPLRLLCKAAGRLYVGNIPWSVDTSGAEEAVRELCAPFSEQEVEVQVPWLDKKKKKLQKHRGYAFVQFADEAEATAALEGLQGAEVLGNLLKVNSASPPPEVPEKVPQAVVPSPRGRQHVKLYVGNLPIEMDAGALKEMFSDCGGSIVDCKVLLDKNGESRGFGFLTLSNPNAADSAMNKQGSFLQGHYRDKGGVVNLKEQRLPIVVNMAQ